VLIGVYRGQPTLAELCERLVDLDEGLMEWRYRHVKMVSARSGPVGAPAEARVRTYLLAHPQSAAVSGSLGDRTEL